MRILVSRIETYELVINDEGYDTNGVNFSGITDTLADLTADDEEITRTVSAIVEDSKDLAASVKINHKVVIRDDDDGVLFLGRT